MLGTYYFKHATSQSPLVLTDFKLRVEVIAEKGERYQVKYLGWHPSGAAYGSLHWVKKKKVLINYSNIK